MTMLIQIYNFKNIDDGNQQFIVVVVDDTVDSEDKI